MLIYGGIAGVVCDGKEEEKIFGDVTEDNKDDVSTMYDSAVRVVDICGFNSPVLYRRMRLEGMLFVFLAIKMVPIRNCSYSSR